MASLLIGIDIGTYSSKGVLCRPDGSLVASAKRDHGLSVPRAGWAEQDADAVWWEGFGDVSRRLMAQVPAGDTVGGLAVSAIGPCVLPVDREGRPLRPGILYGIDTRATEQITALEGRYGREALVELSGMRLTSQAGGPKIAWIRENEPAIHEATFKYLTASSYLVHRLTGRFVIDRHTASHWNPLFDIRATEWDTRFAQGIVDQDRLPDLSWSDEIVGHIGDAAARETGLPAGTPVTAGTIDALAEAVSVGALEPGDLMLMYGTTAYLILMLDRPSTHPDLWVAAGIRSGQFAFEAGMSTTGAITTWFRDQFARELLQGKTEPAAAYGLLAGEAEASPAGSKGLIVLPYFSGERTPIHDPDARGVFAGLSLAHTRGDLYRALLEGTGYGLRQVFESMTGSGAEVRRVIAVGGGASNRLWVQIVSDIARLEQEIPSRTIGAAYGDAFLAGIATGVVSSWDAIGDWVSLAETVAPDETCSRRYDGLYELYLSLYSDSMSVVHRLAAISGTGTSRGG